MIKLISKSTTLELISDHQKRHIEPRSLQAPIRPPPTRRGPVHIPMTLSRVCRFPPFNLIEYNYSKPMESDPVEKHP